MVLALFMIALFYLAYE